MPKLSEIRQSPNILARDYRHAGVGARIMLTGHIHQAIPDCAEKGYQEHWNALNKYGEERWDMVFDKRWQLREGFAAMIDSAPENIALAASVHDLFIRFLSVLPLDKRKRIVTSDCEHPSIARQLVRLQEQGIELVEVPALPSDSYITRLEKEIDDQTAAVCVSSVNFLTGQMALELDTLLPVCQKFGAELFVDAYLSINVLSFSVDDYNLEQAFVAGGGAKYCQMGNGNCFMHVPPARDFRPIITGWFGQFDPIIDSPAAKPLAYSDDASRFDGSSDDALAVYRACHVLDYFKKTALDTDFLHDISHHQINHLSQLFKAANLDPSVIQQPVECEYLGGFLALKSPHAQKICEHMRDIGVHTDFRRHWLRLGPAPYLCDEQLEDGITALVESITALGL